MNDTISFFYLLFFMLIYFVIGIKNTVPPQFVNKILLMHGNSVDIYQKGFVAPVFKLQVAKHIT